MPTPERPTGLGAVAALTSYRPALELEDEEVGGRVALSTRRALVTCMCFKAHSTCEGCVLQAVSVPCHLWSPVLSYDLAVSVCASYFICRLVSGNSIEEKLLKNGTKDLIREVAAQGNDYSMAFLTQVSSFAGSSGVFAW